MKPKLAVDMDEVLAHFLPAFIEFHNEKYGTNVSKKDFFSYEFWTIFNESPTESIQKVYDFHKTDYFKNIAPISEAQKAISKLKQKYELVIITSRQKEVQDQTIEWVEKHFPETFSNIYFTNNNAQNTEKKQKKSEICNRINIPIIIEDCLEYAEDCAHNKKEVYLLDQPWNQSQKKHPQIHRVYSWDEILIQLEKNYEKLNII